MCSWNLHNVYYYYIPVAQDTKFVHIKRKLVRGNILILLFVRDTGKQCHVPSQGRRQAASPLHWAQTHTGSATQAGSNTLSLGRPELTSAGGHFRGGPLHLSNKWGCHRPACDPQPGGLCAGWRPRPVCNPDGGCFLWGLLSGQASWQACLWPLAASSWEVLGACSHLHWWLLPPGAASRPHLIGCDYYMPDQLWLFWRPG